MYTAIHCKAVYGQCNTLAPACTATHRNTNVNCWSFNLYLLVTPTWALCASAPLPHDNCSVGPCVKTALVQDSLSHPVLGRGVCTGPGCPGCRKYIGSV